jgi:predicted enzyme related to lactoylglutathione lyase
MSEKGRFVWRDLMTNDLEGSIKFYTELFGWETQQVEMGGMGTYTFIEAGGRRDGGMVAMDPSREIPAHWLSYLTVDDVDELVKRAPGLGAEVLYPPTDIPEVGRFAVLADPTGAAFAPFKGTEPPPAAAEGTMPAGAFCWNELLARNTEKATEFYTQVCGWTAAVMEMDEGRVYTVFKRGDEDAGGMLEMPEAAEGPSNWLVYVAVDDVDAIAQRIEELGGCLFVHPQDIPGIGRFAVAADPGGAVFAVYRSAKA